MTAVLILGKFNVFVFHLLLFFLLSESSRFYLLVVFFLMHIITFLYSYNSGTCVDGDNWYRCECAPGFAGPDCRISKSFSDSTLIFLLLKSCCKTNNLIELSGRSDL